MKTPSENNWAAPPALVEFIATESRQPVTDRICKLSALIAERHGDASAVVLHYGSCLRTGDDLDGIIDLYLLVDNYQDVYGPSLAAIANRLLPPNVFYFETQIDGHVLRTKYALVSLAHFTKLSSPSCFNASIWARFSQPAAISWSRDDASAEQARFALARALSTMLVETEGLLPARRTADEWWVAALSASYAAELRPESGQSAAERLVMSQSQRYADALSAAYQLTHANQDTSADTHEPSFVSALDARAITRCQRRWQLRRLQGKFLNALRLMKAVFTFSGAVEYALWKVERHSGVRVKASAFQKRWPLLGIWPLAWKLYRKGAFR